MMMDMMGMAAGMMMAGREEQARERANAVDDIDDEEYKKTLRLEIRKLEIMAIEEEKVAGMYQDER